MMDQRITEITIVGGGTAGWMTAACLISFLNFRRQQNPLKITLIESPNVPTIGVGEATVPTMPHLLKSLGISEKKFIKRCNASFKLGVRFSNWNQDESGRGLSYIHPFDGMGNSLAMQNPAYHYHKFGGLTGTESFDDCLSPSIVAINNMRGPKGLDQREFESHLNYAYHLDAGLFAKMLKEISIERGVEHILDDVDDVELDEKGFVSALQLQRGGRKSIQFVVDCTGFRGLVINKALGVPFHDYSKFLLNNRALAVQLPHQDPTKLEPCTTSTALGAGWVWRVPLFNRVGTGYVFSGDFRTDEQAMDEFMAYLGDEGKGASPRAIPVRVGRLERAWEKNCVAIGLSSGFIEPLESTAIYMIETSVKLLLQNFPDKTFPVSLANHFNHITRTMVNEIRDFIILHYCTNNRTDTDYWKAAREDVDIPDSVSEILERYRHALPVSDSYDSTFLFNYWSYLIVLFGKNYFKGIKFPMEDVIVKDDWVRQQNWLAGLKQNLLQKLPDHYSLLCHLRGVGLSKQNQFALAGNYGAMQSTVQFGSQSAAAKINMPQEEMEKQDLSESFIL
jgi:tryptophan halogenase